MGRFRNPRYAPEFLERRLSPSTMVPRTGDVRTLQNTDGDPSEPVPAPGDGTPPTTAPTCPPTPGFPA